MYHVADAISPRKGSGQHRNIIWDINKSGVQIPSYVPLSSCAPQPGWSHSRKPDRSLSFPGSAGIAPHAGWSHEPRAVITRGTVVKRGTEVYFSVSSYRYECPAYGYKTRMPHYVFNYNTSDDEWSTLPECRVHDFGLAVVDGLVTVVGGEIDEIYIFSSLISGDLDSSDDEDSHQPVQRPSCSNSLHVLEEQYGCWNEEHFPPMAMARKDPAVICVQQYLIVAGGVSDRVLYNSVELMNIKTKTWTRVASLPEAVSSLTAACCGDQLYFLGGRNKKGSTSAVFTCSVQSLVMSSDSGEKLKQEVNEYPVWRKVADVPALRSTCVAINDDLFAVGGRTSSYRPVADIYCYNRLEDSWQIAGQIPTARSMCIAAFVMNKLVVVGGLIENDEPTVIVETGTFVPGMLTCNPTKI